MTILIHVCFSFLSTVTFGILTNIPKRALIATGIAGTVGWMIYWQLHEMGMALAVPIFMLPLRLAVSASFFHGARKCP